MTDTVINGATVKNAALLPAITDTRVMATKAGKNKGTSLIIFKAAKPGEAAVVQKTMAPELLFKR